MTLLLQPRQTEYTFTEEHKTLKAAPKGFFLEQAAELLRIATFYREWAQQFERVMKNPHKLPPLVKQDEEVPRPKQGNPKWLNNWYRYYWWQMDKATSYERQPERILMQTLTDNEGQENSRMGTAVTQGTKQKNCLGEDERGPALRLLSF